MSSGLKDIVFLWRDHHKVADVIGSIASKHRSLEPNPTKLEPKRINITSFRNVGGWDPTHIEWKSRSTSPQRSRDQGTQPQISIP